MGQITPLRALRAKCLWCCDGQRVEPKRCPATDCPIHPYRCGSIPDGASRNLIPVIRAKCLECADGPADVRDCDGCPDPVHGPCPLHPFRFGKRPVTAMETACISPKNGPDKGEHGIDGEASDPQPGHDENRQQKPLRERDTT